MFNLINDFLAANNIIPRDSKLFFSHANRIKTYDFKTNKTSLFYETSKDIVTFDASESSLFYIEKGLSMIESVYSTHFNVTFTIKVEPQAIAVDSLTKKFYILDKFAGTVNVIDFDVRNFGVVLSDLEEPHDIVIDVEEGSMFILQYMKSVTIDCF